MRIIIMLIGLILSEGIWAQIDKDFFLIARNTGEKQLADSSILRVFGFAEDLSTHPNVPGPTLVVQEGDSVEIDLWNVSQGAPHTIHLHGLDVDQENDGVPHLSFEIMHMDHGFYRFEAPHAGTYLYHCHVASTIHVQAGMYGLIIVKERNNEKKTWTNGHAFDREFSFLCSEIDTTWHTDSVLKHDHGPTVKVVPVPPYNPQFFLVNGYSDQQLPENFIEIYGAKNEAIYLRLANIGFYGNTYHFPLEMSAQILSSDGRPLPNPEQSDSVVLLPGERYGVMLYPSDTFNGEVKIDYFNMNSMISENTQILPLRILETASNSTVHKESIEIYPNPFSESFQIRTGGSLIREVYIHDLNGRVVWKQEQQSNSSEVEIQPMGLNKGVYFLRFIDEVGHIHSQKLVKY